MLDPVALKIASLFIGLLLIVAALHKTRNFDGFRTALEGYDLLPSALIFPASVLIIFYEAVMGLGLLISTAFFYGAAGLFLFYGAMIAISLMRGKAAIDCGCHFGGRESRLSWWMIPRNLVLVLLAALPAFGSSAREILAIDYINITGGILFLGLMYMAVEEILSNRSHYFNHILKKEMGYE